jgi:hypothetical protein
MPTYGPPSSLWGMEAPAQTDPTVASRPDPNTGIVDFVGFFGPRGRKLFGCLHLPAAPPVGAVVVCSSLHAGFELNYRREVLLARSLAAMGVAVARFHYRGTGNSDGDVAHLTVDTMAEDTVRATDWLSKRTGISLPAYLGSGWGGLPAASAAARVGDGPLALWEPVVQPSGYFRGAVRARASRDVKDGVTARHSPNMLVEALDRDGRFEVLGYPIERALHRSASGRSLTDEVGDRPRPVLLVQIGRRRRLRADYAALAGRWRERGFPVETRVVSGEGSWWFVGARWEPEERRATTVDVVNASADWILRQARVGS